MVKYLRILSLMGFLVPILSYSQNCTSTPQVNAVVNGDFEAGYIASGPGSFTTDQLYVYDPSNSGNSALMDAVLANPAGPQPCAWNSDGRYHIASYFGAFTCDGGNYNGHPFLSESDGRYDHTQGIGGTGKYLMIDSKNGALSGLGITLWEQDVTVVPNSQYYFSGWFINFSPVSNGANRVSLRFVVEYFNSSNVSLGVFQLGSNFSPADASRGNNWEQAYVTTTSPAGAVTAKIGIYNQTANVLVGNDVAIDDISFSNGCQAISGAPNPPTPGLGPDQNICSVSGNITLNSGVATAAPNREFSWYSVSGSTETPLVSNSTTQNTYTVTGPGTYRVCVYEPSGCAKSDYITITQTNSLNLGSDVSLCQPNSSSATLTASPAASGPVYTYAWLRNAAAYPGTTNSITVSTTGTYTLNATHPSRAACNVTDDVIVSNTNSMTTDIGSNQDLCSGNATFTSSLTGTAFTYQWLKDGVAIPGATSASYTASIAGVYQLNITHPVAGCNLSDNATVTSTNVVTANHGNFCAPPATTVNLSVTGPGTFNWFDAPTGGTTLATNTSTYTTPSISTTTTYYVEDMTSSAGTALSGGAFGGADYWPTFASGEDGNPEGIAFTTLKNNVTLASVDVFVQEWAQVSNVQIDIVNVGTSAVIGSSALVVGPSPAIATGTPYQMTIPLNVTIPTTGNYKMVFRMGVSGAGPLRAETSGFTGVDGTGTIDITGSADDNRNYFRNIVFSAGSNSCSRLPVTAYHTGACPLPIIDTGNDGPEANLQKLEMSVYPNPTHAGVTIELESGVDQALYKLTEINGRIVEEGVIGNVGSLDMHALAKGMYILEVQTMDKINFTKIVKD